MITAPAGGGDTGLYHLGAKIGEGSFGTVFKAVRLSADPALRQSNLTIRPDGQCCPLLRLLPCGPA